VESAEDHGGRSLTGTDLEERRPDLPPDAPAVGKLEGFRRVRANANAAKQGAGTTE